MYPVWWVEAAGKEEIGRIMSHLDWLYSPRNSRKISMVQGSGLSIWPGYILHT
jgi:hypothetical protein